MTGFGSVFSLSFPRLPSFQALNSLYTSCRQTIAEHAGVDGETALQNILYCRAYNSEQQWVRHSTADHDPTND